jgi:hypothetical protein
LTSLSILPGSEVLTSYVMPTVCSLLRRARLLEGWYFSCSCQRCASPTELDTHQVCLLALPLFSSFLLYSHPQLKRMLLFVLGLKYFSTGNISSNDVMET